MKERDQNRGRAMKRIAWGWIVVGATAGTVAWGLFIVETVALGPEDWAGWSRGLPLGLACLAALSLILGGWFWHRARKIAHELPDAFLNGDDESKVVEAIRAFEQETSGEIRVHLEYDCRDDPASTATRLFQELGMTATRERNGVLFFVGVHDRTFAVVGDEGIDRVVPEGFWDDVVTAVTERFAMERYTDGLIDGIRLASAAMAPHFPPRHDDSNELPDTIS